MNIEMAIKILEYQLKLANKENAEPVNLFDKKAVETLVTEVKRQIEINKEHQKENGKLREEITNYWRNNASI